MTKGESNDYQDHSSESRIQRMTLVERIANRLLNGRPDSSNHRKQLVEDRRELRGVKIEKTAQRDGIDRREASLTVTESENHPEIRQVEASLKLLRGLSESQKLNAQHRIYQKALEDVTNSLKFIRTEPREYNRLKDVQGYLSVKLGEVKDQVDDRIRRARSGGNSDSKEEVIKRVAESKQAAAEGERRVAASNQMKSFMQGEGEKNGEQMPQYWKKMSDALRQIYIDLVYNDETFVKLLVDKRIKGFDSKTWRELTNEVTRSPKWFLNEVQRLKNTELTYRNTYFDNTGKFKWPVRQQWWSNV